MLAARVKTLTRRVMSRGLKEIVVFEITAVRDCWPSNFKNCTAHVRSWGKADMTIRACLLLRSLMGVKRTWLVAAHMSAYDPKRTCVGNSLWVRRAMSDNEHLLNLQR